jgi:tRNA G10  N-methylase Trm11
MKYAFILGRNPSLSVAELVRAVPSFTLEGVYDEVAVGSCPELAPGFINLLGGTVKIAAIDSECRNIAQITSETLRAALPPREGRVIFGISAYGRMNGPQRRSLYMEGLALKKAIKDEGRRCRYVVSRETQLSSVVVAKNKLIEEGAEFTVIAAKDKAFLGTTLAIQEFEAYGERDFDRPGRSARRGMLPPKLCQMMINIAKGDKSLPLLDPFCGSGTVLGEALLLGYSQVIGTDMSEEAVKDTRAYLEWLEARHPEIKGRWRVFASDARLLDKALDPASVGTIVAEPFLGPPQSGRETREQLLSMMKGELVPLYRDALKSLERLLAPNGTAVISFPVFSRKLNGIFVPSDEMRGTLMPVPLVPSEYSDLRLPSTSSGGVLYERPDQHVGREIVMLKKS